MSEEVPENLDPHSRDAQIEKSAKEFCAEGVNARAYSLSIPPSLKEPKGVDQVSDSPESVSSQRRLQTELGKLQLADASGDVREG